jgi:starch-binding outer membrane protein, SusD/RagB family
MKKFSLYLITAAALATGMSSCKKELDLQPTDTFSENNAFLDLSDVQLGVNAVYGRYGTYVNDMYVSALVSDEAKLGPDNSGQGALTYRYQYSSDNTSGDDVTSAWGGYYSVIDQCNRVLPKIDEVSTSPAEATRRNQLKGQLLAMRAISHFGLLQAYCKNYNAADPKGVPVMLTSNPISKPSRNTMGQVMSQIESDLSQAKTLLPPVSASNFRDTVMNRVNIAAYQARIALYKKDYDAAINFATEVISSGARSLAQGSQFAAIWTDDDVEAEVLFRIRFATSTSVGGIWTTTGGSIYIAPSDKLTEKYSPDDVRATAYIGEDASGNRYVNKFFTSGRGGRVVDMKACRIAEMYLIRAEANARKATPDIASASTDLNRLRRARIDGYVDETFSNASALINAIMDERFKELAFEGFRFWDLKRNNMPVNRSSSDAAEAWRTLPATNHRFVLPIPNDEILANPNMSQNDLY